MRKVAWTNVVKGATNGKPLKDLHAADAVYHQQCSVHFRTSLNIPIKRLSSTLRTSKSKQPTKKGRPVDEQTTAFLSTVAQFLENNDDEQITLTDLCHKVHEILQEAGLEKEPYTEKHPITKVRKSIWDSHHCDMY